MRKNLHLFSRIKFQSAHLWFNSKISPNALPSIGDDDLPAAFAQFHVPETNSGYLVLVLKVQVVVWGQYHHYLRIFWLIELWSMSIIHWFWVSQSLTGFIVDVIFIFLEEELAGLPKCLIAEENEFIVHLNSCDENGVLKVIAEITQNGL